jgi:hypothetical protein
MAARIGKWTSNREAVTLGGPSRDGPQLQNPPRFAHLNLRGRGF